MSVPAPGKYERIAMVRRRDALLERFKYDSRFTRSEVQELDGLIEVLGGPEENPAYIKPGSLLARWKEL